MANQKHVSILKQGVDVWNSWREKNLLVMPDLTRADLRESDLCGANLSGADLSVANLFSANLSGADLSGVDFTGARLRWTNLSRTNLSDACLIGAELLETNLDEADISKAWLAHTTFGNIDFSRTKGLGEVVHIGPSTVGIDSIYISEGRIPEIFLRGCGLSNLQIEFAKLASPNLSSDQVTEISYKIRDLYCGGDTIQYYSCFISYSSKDEEFAQQLHGDLQNNGIRCWFAPQDIQSGKKIYEQINEAIRIHDRLLLILSEDSMDSEWVKTEIFNAREKETKEKRRVLFPIHLVDFQQIRKWKCLDPDTGKDIAKEIREYFILDFSSWKNQETYKSSFERLLRDLKVSNEKQ